MTRTERTDVTDAEAPPGAQLFYSVFAARDGESWSAPASAPSATFTPEVTGLSVGAADTSVAATWRAHPGADRVIVVRREDEPPRRLDDGTAVEASPDTFTEAGLRTGTEYYYRITTCYRTPDGLRRYSPGVVTRAVPEPAPVEVTDLRVTGPDDGARRWWPPGRHHLTAGCGWSAATSRCPGPPAPASRRTTRPGCRMFPAYRAAAPTAAMSSNCACRPDVITSWP